tara:strand:+ start:77 stop:754 length:678 start_codon:yes stop_codon:yes gene_type:complete
MSNKEAIAALAKAQSQMDTPHKDATNPHYGNKYASLKSCIKAIKPALNKNEFALVQSAGRDDLGDFIETTFEHSSGGKFQSKFYLSVDKKGMQGMGSAATYAKRYGLLGLAGIEPDEQTDDDASAANNDEKKAAAKKAKADAAKAEAAHDAAVREEQNRAPTTPQQLKEMIENKIKLASATWQLKKMTQEHGKDFNTIKQHDAKMGAELNAYFKTRFEQLNHGER